MTSHSVREVSLRLRTVGQPGPTVRSRAEKFVAEVLEQLGDTLESQFPGRIILIRSLPLRWSLTEQQLEPYTEVTKAVEQLVATLDIRIWPGIEPPSDETDLIVFSDEAHWRATYVVAASSNVRADAWYYRSLDYRSTPWEFALRNDLPRVEQLDALCSVLQLLDSEQKLSAVLDVTSMSELRAIAEVLQASTEQHGGQVLHDQSTLGPDLATESDGNGQRDWRSALTQRMHLIACIMQHTHTQQLPTSLPWQAARVSKLRLPSGQYAHGTSLGEARTTHESEAVQYDEAVLSEEPSIAAYPTKFAGLFYFLRLALELEVGEILWKACLPEGEILARVAHWILGVAGREDPAAKFFGGIQPESNWSLSPAQHAEVCLPLIDAMVQAIPRRGLAQWPSTQVSLIRTTDGRWLTVASEDHLLFTWPAESLEDFQLGLNHFLKRWPRSAPPPSSLSDFSWLDSSGRLVALPTHAGNETHQQTRIKTLDDALIGQIAGTLLRLGLARLQSVVDGDIGTDAEAGLIRQHGLLQRQSGQIRVLLPMSAIRLDVRKAGLDQDPGWVPWLGANVTFEYRGDS